MQVSRFLDYNSYLEKLEIERIRLEAERLRQRELQINLCLKRPERCNNGNCLIMHSKEVCDGKIDCLDGADEVGCTSMYILRTY